MSQEPGQLVANKYRLERPLARGGMGSVWVARHVELDVDVALKFRRTSDDFDGDSARRFKREARAAAQLRGPHIVHIHDYGLHEGTPYIAMELLAGEDLGQLLAREGRLSLPRALHWLRQAAKALRVVHRAGIVHRDIKPSNLFLAEHHGDTVLEMLDFGIAKTPDEGGATTSAGLLLGSPAYMSPEQARGNPVDARSDLWSLAAVFYRMLTGQAPFEGASSGDILVKLCTEDVAPPSSVAPHLGPGVDEFFRRALARDPNDRFRDVDELVTEAARLAAGAGDEPGDARDGFSHASDDGGARTTTAVPPESAHGASNPGRTTPTASIRVSLPTFERTQASHAPARAEAEGRPWLRPVGVPLLLTLVAIILWLRLDRSPASSPSPEASPTAPVADSPAFATTARDANVLQGPGDVGPAGAAPESAGSDDSKPYPGQAGPDDTGPDDTGPDDTSMQTEQGSAAPQPPRDPAPPSVDADARTTSGTRRARVPSKPAHDSTATSTTATSSTGSSSRAPSAAGTPASHDVGSTPPADPVFGLPLEEPAPSGERP